MNSSIGMTHAAPRMGAPSMRLVLLGCSIVSLLTYLAADLIGGLSYPGYNFASQAVSELMARGAPSEQFVDPLFLAYDALVLAFGVGVYLEAKDRLPLKIAGISLAIYGIIGLTGPTLFEMEQRGTGSVGTDLPHILATAALALLLILAIGIGGFGLGKRFRAYSLATVAVVVGFGALTAPFAARLAAGQPTPGFGIIERVTIYAALLWIAVLGILLMRHRRAEP